jgi:NAD(P)-dependent dehydrogenase (short-subunit alcohol dehydrogenase family)
MAPNATKVLASYRLPPNKTAVVVGGTNGIGAAIARLMVRLGCVKVVIVGRSEEKGRKLCETMKELAPSKDGFETALVTGDLSYVVSVYFSVFFYSCNCQDH